MAQDNVSDLAVFDTSLDCDGKKDETKYAVTSILKQFIQIFQICACHFIHGQQMQL